MTIRSYGGRVLRIAAALFSLLGFMAVTSPNPIAASPAAEIDRILGDCPGECVSLGCSEEGNHYYTPDLDPRDESYGRLHPYPECEDKPCCWQDGEDGLHPSCGEPCSAGLALGREFDKLEKAAANSDADALFAVLSNSKFVTLNIERSAIQLHTSCGDRFVGTLPVDQALALELQQRLLAQRQ